MAQVTLKDVRKVYGADTLVVKDISLAIRDGEFMVLVGPSGCGKSTTLRMVAGLEEITSGTIMIGDKVVNDVEPRARNIAMVFQNYALYPHMTVADNMTFSLRVKKEPKDVIRKRLAEVAEILGLELYLQRKPKELSGGQRQRVAMGRALVRNPEVFLFDEPLSNLDAKMRVEMRHEIIKMHQRVKATMIYVTHDQVEAMTLGDRICIMEGGVIQQVGEPGFVFDNPNNLFVAGFIGTPPMNLFTGALRMDGGRAVFEGDGMTAALPGGLLENVREHIGRRVALGLRPRAFHEEGDADDGVAWEAVPEISEMLGEESLVHMRIGAQKFIVTMHPQRIPPLNKPVTVRPIMNRAHIFDADSGKNLTLDVDLPGRTSVRRTTA